MHLVSPDRIILDPRDPRPGYSFDVAGLGWDMRVVDIAESARHALVWVTDPKLRHRAYPPERELEAVLAALADASEPTAVLGVSSASAVLAARSAYATLGYYRAETNRISVPEDAPCRLGVRIEHLLYSLKDSRRYTDAMRLDPPLRDPGDSLALARAVNFGVVSWILLPEDDASAEPLLRELIERDIVPLVSLASSLARRGPGSTIRIFA